VLQESRDECLHRERGHTLLATARMSVTKGYSTLAETHQSMIGKSNSVDVPREVERGMAAAADPLNMYGPGSIPDLWIDLACKPRARYRMPQFGAEDCRQHVARHHESAMRWLHPRTSVA
jgi:hypothetical protein